MPTAKPKTKPVAEPVDSELVAFTMRMTRAEQARLKRVADYHRRKLGPMMVWLVGEEHRKIFPES